MFAFASAYLKERRLKHTDLETQETNIIYNGTGYARLVNSDIDAQISYGGRPIEAFYPHLLLQPRGHDISITEDENRVFNALIRDSNKTINLQGSEQSSISYKKDYIIITIPQGATVDVRTDNSRIPIIFNIIDK